MDETRRWWEATAAYFQDETNISVGLDWGPGVPEGTLDILPPVKNRTVLELGCGGGQLGVGVAERGASQVVGVDFSRAQLGFAAELVADRGVPMALVEGDVTQAPVRSDWADIVVSAYVAQWVPDLTAMFSEAARILRPGGVFVCSLPHPFYGVFDPEDGSFRRSYHEPGALRFSEDGIDVEQVLHYRRISDIFEAVQAAGLDLERVAEPGDADPAAYEDQWDSKPELMAHVPRTLVFRASLPEG
jgi:SAM-dependent methyltransferase